MAVMAEDKPQEATAPFGIGDTGRALRERLVDFHTLSWPVRLMVLFTAVFLLTLLLVVAGIDTNVPALTRTVAIYTAHPDHVYLAVYVLTLVAYLIGFTFLLASILQSRGALPVVLTTALTLVLGYPPIFHLTSRFTAPGFVTWPYALQLALIAALWAAVLTSSVARSRGGPSTVALRYAFPAALLFVVAYYLLTYWNILSAGLQGGLVLQRVVAEVIQDVALQGLFVGLLGLILAYLASTGIVEMSETVSKVLFSFVYRLRSRWVIVAIQLVVALALIADVLVRDAPDMLAARRPATLLTLAVAALAAYYARSRPGGVPLLGFPAILAGAAVLWISTALPYSAMMFGGGYGRLSPLGVDDVAVVISALITVGAGGYGLVLLRRARATGANRASDMGVLLIVLSLLLLQRLVAQCVALLDLGHLYVVPPDFDTCLVVLASASVLCMALVAVANLSGLGQRQGTEWLRRLPSFFTLGLLLIKLASYLPALLDWLPRHLAVSPTAIALVVLATLVWHFLLSGETNNQSTAAFPRSARLLHHLSFILFSTSTLVFANAFTGSQIAPITGSLMPGGNGAGTISALTLVPAVILTTVVTRAIGARPVTTVDVSFPQERSAAMWRRMPRMVVSGSFALMLVALAPAVLVDAWAHARPDQPTATYTSPYLACDPGVDLNWTVVPASTAWRCTDRGLELAVPAHGAVGLAFFLPNSIMPPSYRVSTVVDFGSLPRGCLALWSRVSFPRWPATGAPRNAIANDLCADGHFYVAQVAGGGASLSTLSVGAVSLKEANVVMAESELHRQVLWINGVSVADSPAATDTNDVALRGIYFLASNNGTSQASLFMRDFSLTAAGKSQFAGDVAPTYRAPVPGPKCDRGPAQWALDVPSTATCTGAGLVITAVHRLEALHFALPLGHYFTQHYQAGMQADFPGEATSCVQLAQITSGGTPIHMYATALCTDGTWEVATYQGGQSAVLAHGRFPPSRILRFTVTLEGGIHLVNVNGILLPSVYDGGSFLTRQLAIFVGSSTQTTIMTLSDFTYTQLDGVPVHLPVPVATPTAMPVPSATATTATPIRPTPTPIRPMPTPIPVIPTPTDTPIPEPTSTPTAIPTVAPTPTPTA